MARPSMRAGRHPCSIFPVLIVVLPFLTSRIALAAVSRSPIQFAIEPGLQGFHRTGEWMPVAVTVQNEGSEQELYIGVPMDPQPGIWTRVVMPGKSRKRVRLYVPLRGMGLLERLENLTDSERTPGLFLEIHSRGDGRGRGSGSLIGRVKIPYQPVSRQTYAVALIDEEDLHPGFLRGHSFALPGASHTSQSLSIPAVPPSPDSSAFLNSNLGLQPSILNLRSDLLPEQVAALEPCDCIAMRPETLNRLSQEQRAALRGWMERGGILLLFAGSPQTINSSSTQEFCPVIAGGTRVFDQLLSIEDTDSSRSSKKLQGPFVINDIRVAGSDNTDGAGDGDAVATVEIREGRAPLLVVKPIGFGGVAYFGLDLTSEVIRKWTGGPSLWMRVMELLMDRLQRLRHLQQDVRVTTPTHYKCANISDDPNLTRFLRQLRGVTPPPRWALGVIAVIYIFVFGPINVWLMRRVRRSERGWLTTPALSAVFAILLLICGFRWSGGRSVITQVSFLECRSGATTAQEEVIYSLFAPVHGFYTFRFNDGCIFLEDKTAEEDVAARTPQRRRFQSTADKFPPAADASSVIQTLDNTIWPDIRVGVWSMKRFRTCRTAALRGYVGMSFNRNLDGSITNKLPTTLRQCLLVSGRSRVSLGSLSRGETRKVKSNDWTEVRSVRLGAPGREFDDYVESLPLTMVEPEEVTLLARIDQPLLRIDAGEDVRHHTFGVLIARTRMTPQ